MQFKKIFKYSPIVVIAASLAIATGVFPYSVNNSDYSKEQIFNTDQKVSDTDNSDQLEYIKNDVVKQDGANSPIVSIDINDVTKDSTSITRASSSSANHSAAIVTKADGSTLLYMWGDNKYGQLGFAANTSANTIPKLVPVAAFNSKKISQIALGDYHSAALMDDGSLYMWGYNSAGQLGNGSKNDKPTPTLVTYFNSKRVTQIALGLSHSAALLDDNSLYMWGRNVWGQLGNGSTNDTSTPTLVSSTHFDNKKITQIALSEQFSAALTEDNGLYMWGQNHQGQLGFTSNTGANNSPTIIPIEYFASKKIIQIALGDGYSGALVEDGSLYTWGLNNGGQLGNGGWQSLSVPGLVNQRQFAQKKVIRISFGGGHSAAILEDGSLYMWGRNEYSQLGVGLAGAKKDPIKVTMGIGSRKVVQFVLGKFHSSVILEDGRMFTWGWNNRGQLGNGSTSNIIDPSWMTKLGKDSHITANDAITAKEAVDKFWVNEIFNLEGFKNSFNLTNILETNGQQITMTTAPSPDNDARTVTMNVNIKYYYNEDGLIVSDTAAKAIIVSGFKKAPTDMIINPNYPRTRVDLFAFNILYHKGSDLYNYLVKDYVIATSVDANNLTVRIIDQNNQTGKISIALTIPSYFDNDLNIVEELRTYIFDYDLAPKYQQTIIKTLDISIYPKDITPVQFKSKINDGGAVADGDSYILTESNITFLGKFLSFQSVPASTIYTLTWNTEETNDLNGVLSFNLSLNQHYSADGDFSTTALSVNLILNLLGTEVPVWPETIITTKANAPLIVSSQSFLDNVYSNGIISNDKLSLYVDGLQTIPASGDVTGISTKVTTDKVVTFILEVSAHYNAKGLLKGSKLFEFSLNTNFNIPKYTQTNITVLPVGTYPTDLTPTQFRQQLVTDGAIANGSIYTLNSVNGALLDKFLDLTTVPPDTRYMLSINIEQTSDATGQISFNLIIDQYYNADGDLVTGAAKPFNDLVLQLANADVPAIKPATDLRTKDDSPLVASKNAFMKMIYTNNNHLIYAQLNIFVDGLLTIPTGAKVSVIYVTEKKSVAMFRIILSSYYDGMSSDVIDEEKFYHFDVNVKYNPATYYEFPIWWFIIVCFGAGSLLIVFIGLTAIRYQQWAAKKRKAKIKKVKSEKPDKKLKRFKAVKNDGTEKEQKTSDKKAKWFKTNKAKTEQIKPKGNVKLLESKATEQVRKPKVDNEAKMSKTSNNISEKAKTSKTNVKQVEPKVSDTVIKQAKKTKTQTEPKDPKSSDQVPKKVKTTKPHNDQLKQSDSKNIIEPTQPKSSDQASKKVKTDKPHNDQPKRNDPKKTIKTDTKQQTPKNSKKKTSESKTLNSKPKVDNATDLPKKKTDTKPK